jgi:hypothetical protein
MALEEKENSNIRFEIRYEKKGVVPAKRRACACPGSEFVAFGSG